MVSAEGDAERILKCLVSGFFANAARMLPDGSYASLRGAQSTQAFHLQMNSVLFNRSAQFVIFHEVVQTSKIFMREVSAIQPQWLSELAPHYYEFSSSQQRHEQIVRQTEDPQLANRFRSVF